MRNLTDDWFFGLTTANVLVVKGVKTTPRSKTGKMERLLDLTMAQHEECKKV
jgi:hypothetical protein